MTISPVQLTQGLTQTTSSSSTSSSATGKDQFMLLLLAQLKNQDPLKPMEDREFITQLAQFNLLEETQKMNENLIAMMYMDQFTQSSALIGKTVTATNPNTGDTITGTVSEVSFKNGIAELLINGTEVPLENVLNVR